MTTYAASLAGKPYLRYPDAIDTRLVFRIYAWLAIPAGLYGYVWANEIPSLALPVEGVPWSIFAPLRVAAAVVVGAGICAIGFAAVSDSIDRGRALLGFALAHLVSGLLFFMQWNAIFSGLRPPIVGWIPLIVGMVLLYAATTASTATPMRRIVAGGLFSGAERKTVSALRSQYEEHIQQAARQEERARLARDLHDAVKQQLFVIQTAAATAEARYHRDPTGATGAIGQIRAAAREAIVEMQALIEQLQAAPMENVGLVEALRKQCEALGFRTGAEVSLNINRLPPSEALPPGAQLALFRAAQEALANVGRHARARHVDVMLGMSGNHLELTIRDDGTGFESSKTPAGMGLRNMAQRADELEGSFTLDSSPGKGTSIRLSVPCHPSFESTSREYRRRALGWAAVLVVMAGTLALRGVVNHPLSLAATAITAIMVARFTVACSRLRRRSAS